MLGPSAERCRASARQRSKINLRNIQPAERVFIRRRQWRAARRRYADGATCRALQIGSIPCRAPWSSIGPGLAPLSRSHWRTHLRSVSTVQPILPAVDSIAAHCDGHWSLASKTIRTARSTTSGGKTSGTSPILARCSIEGASSKSRALRFIRPGTAGALVATIHGTRNLEAGRDCHDCGVLHKSDAFDANPGGNARRFAV